MTVLRQLFWIAVLGVIGLFVFFVALGAFSPGEVLGISIAVAVLAALWLLHAWLQRRAGSARDPAVTRARERRGF